MTDIEFVDVEPPRPAMTGDQLRLLTFVAAHPTPRPEPDRDHLGRYKLVHPVTGKVTSWTRATTLAGTIDDTYNIQKWANRKVAIGVAMNGGIADQLARLTDPDGEHKQDAQRLADQAKALAGGSLSAEIGTAMHCLTEHYDLGTDLDLSPVGAPWTGDLAAYVNALGAASIVAPPEWVERIVIVPDLGVAGTLDRIVTLPDGRHCILDVKSGSSIDYSLGSIAAQLSLYAHASHMWTGDGYEAMPAVDQEVALVAHMPAGSGTCTLHEVDIAAGWDLVGLCVKVREARKVGRKLGRLHEPVLTGPPPVTEATIRDRIATIKEQTPELAAPLRTAWDVTGIAKRPPWTPDELATLDAMTLEVLMPDEAMAAATATVAATPPAEPEAPTDVPPAPLPNPTDGADPGDHDAATAALRALADDLPDEYAIVRSWVKEATAGDRPWRRGGQLDQRGEAIVHAAVALLRGCWQPDKPRGGSERIRAVLAYVTVADIDPRHPIGAALGSLTTTQATEARLVGESWTTDKPLRATVDAIAKETITGENQ